MPTPDRPDRWIPSPALRKRMKQRSRQLRRAPTPTEAALWEALRDRRLGGWKFRRQIPVGPFIVDFFCAEARLVVEVDGGVHAGQEEADAGRQALIESLGLRVLRVPSSLVEQDIGAVLALIREAVEQARG